jgi:hypothetical protein
MPNLTLQNFRTDVYFPKVVAAACFFAASQVAALYAQAG